MFTILKTYLNTNAIITLLLVLIGCSAALIAWLISRSFINLPKENRTYKDPPPLGFRLVWWPMQWISHYIDPLLSDKTKTTLQTKLRQTGLDYSISPAQFVASRLLCALLSAGFFFLLLASFDNANPNKDGFSTSFYLQVVSFAALFGWLYPVIWLKDRLALRKRELLKTLPFYLDIITLCVEAGLNMQGAMNQAVAKGPKGVLRDEFQRVLRDIRAGKARATALRDMAERLNEPSISNFTTVVARLVPQH